MNIKVQYYEDVRIYELLVGLYVKKTVRTRHEFVPMALVDADEEDLDIEIDVLNDET